MAKTYVWTDEVPGRNRSGFTPGKRYPLVGGNLVLGAVIDDEGDRAFVLIPGCAHLDGRAWNVETVADPAPEPSELERLRAGIRAEIDWHEAEAKRLREIAGHGIKAFILAEKARVHEAAAARLRALLPQPTPEPEGEA